MRQLGLCARTANREGDRKRPRVGRRSGAQLGVDHAPVAMAKCALRIEDGDAVAQVLGRGGHVFLGQRKAGEVDAFSRHPVLHQTLAVQGVGAR